jgi:Zn-dependent peptidase ImmA (M78 family)
MPVRRKRIHHEVESLLSTHRVAAPVVPVFRLARACGAKVVFQEYDQTDDEISGFLYRSKGPIVIGINARHHRNRQRFTAGHELGHLILHEPNGPALHVDRAIIKLRSQLSSQGTDIEEQEANLFAAELLIPTAFIQCDIEQLKLHTADLLDETTIKSLARRYGVSIQALVFRLNYLGYINRE